MLAGNGTAPGAGQFIPPAQVTPSTGTCHRGALRPSFSASPTGLRLPHYELSFQEEAKPCVSCRNSASDACPKLGDMAITPTLTGAVQYSWQMRMVASPISIGGKHPKPRNFIVQKVDHAVNFSAGGSGYAACPSPYWEAFALDDGGNAAIDYWQGDLPGGSAGTWSISGMCYLTETLPAGMQVAGGGCAGNLPWTTSEPKGLGQVAGQRHLGSSFDFTKEPQRHG
jgi:hypothetical protein